MTIHLEPWPSGTPAWADITVPDLQLARDFYGALFGWEFEVGGPETGGYTQALIDEHRVVGLSEPLGDDPAPPPAWCLYLATDDADATAQAAQELGAHVVFPAMQVMDFGRLAILTDPTGAVFGLWEPASHNGWQVVDEPGAPAWSELMTHDQPAALTFYSTLFGLTAEDMSSDGFQYASLHHEGAAAVGIGGYGDSVDAAVPAAWTVYFAAADVDASVARVVEGGGAVVRAPEDTPYGRFALVAGPFGEVFALIASDATAG
ncbi:VOC family protein [Cellulomonas soli]|uniref:VOC family protein n=1 Tax=Cellulomonas soli TaxID=931535 RepID=UPI003F857BEE